MTKILHITIDDKFIESANWQFERIYPGSNKFYIILPNGDHKLRYVKLQPNFEVLLENAETLNRLLNEVKDCDLVVFHGLDDFRCRIVLKSDAKVKFLWSMWGYEVYNYHSYFRKNIYGKFTAKTFRELISKPLRHRLLNILDEIRERKEKSNRFEAIKAIRYYGFPYIEEYSSLKELNLLNSDYFRFTYYPIEFIVKGYENISISGNNILLGNSATMTNNHIEVFEMLKGMDLNNRRVIVPLSYGNNKYRDKLLKLGEDYFGERFTPLTEFYSLEDYNQIIRTCSIFIMNSYRQQGIGNVFAMLWMGAKVYLDERNTTFNYLKRKNCSVFSINADLKAENTTVFEPMSGSEIERNRKIMKQELGEDYLRQELKMQLEKIIG
jgi:hypothetical protein